MQLLQARRPTHWRKTLAIATNAMRRAAGVGNYWYWHTMPELAHGIEIAALICPLRFDVLVRRDFLSFYATNRDLYRSNFAAFVERVRRTSYYTWFITSEAVRCKHDQVSDAAALENEFVARLHRAAKLYDAIEAHGFDRKYPIILKTAEQLLPPTTDRGGQPTGKQVCAHVFLADGCHRLALLMTLGYSVLPAAFFRVKCFREFSPFDSTSLLVRSLAIDPATYFRFLSTRYCAPYVFDRKHDLIRDVTARRPALLDEVHSVIKVDGFADAA